jgi:hypothetical protein
VEATTAPPTVVSIPSQQYSSAARVLADQRPALPGLHKEVAARIHEMGNTTETRSRTAELRMLACALLTSARFIENGHLSGLNTVGSFGNRSGTLRMDAEVSAQLAS